MSTPISFIELPEVPMNLILEYLDFPTVLVLRKVCNDLRNFIDDTKPASRLTVIDVSVTPESISFDLHFPWSPSCVEYLKNGEGCLVKCSKEGNVKETILEDEDYVRIFCKDFNIVLRHQKTVLEEFSISCISLDPIVNENVMESVNKSLKSMNKPLQVKAFHMAVNNQVDILTVLPYIDPKPLELIIISGCSGSDNVVLNLNEIGQLEQWKQADELWIDGFRITDLDRNIKYCSRIVLGFRVVSTEELVLLKEIFICSSTLNTMQICSDGCSGVVIKQKLVEAFGGDHLQDRNWFFRILDNKQILKVTQSSKVIHFNRIEQSDVPQNARIQNVINFFEFFPIDAGLL